jgi:uncharacterized membrane protein
MVLSLNSTMRTVFLIYGVFWVVVVVGLLLAVGALTKRGERERHHGEHSDGAH